MVQSSVWESRIAAAETAFLVHVQVGLVAGLRGFYFPRSVIRCSKMIYLDRAGVSTKRCYKADNLLRCSKMIYLDHAGVFTKLCYKADNLLNIPYMGIGLRGFYFPRSVARCSKMIYLDHAGVFTKRCYKADNLLNIPYTLYGDGSPRFLFPKKCYTVFKNDLLGSRRSFHKTVLYPLYGDGMDRTATRCSEM
jgi:hypothetical protein